MNNIWELKELMENCVFKQTNLQSSINLNISALTDNIKTCSLKNHKYGCIDCSEEVQETKPLTQLQKLDIVNKGSTFIFYH